MIIGHNFVFVHTPKTAGSAFESMMKERHGLSVWGGQHNTVRDIPEEHHTKWTFGFMRDPIKAEISNWRYHSFSWMNNGSFTFERWCRWRYEEERDWGFNLGINLEQMRYGHSFNVRPQAGYFCDAEGRCRADRIFRYEELGPALEEIQNVTGLDVTLPEKKGSETMEYAWSRGREDYSQHITPLSLEILKRAKAIDFELYSRSGPLSLDFTCPTVPNYAYSR